MAWRATPTASSSTSRPRAERMWENPVGSRPEPARDRGLREEPERTEEPDVATVTQLGGGLTDDD